MEDYIGKTCPYCKTIIQEKENIILCSDCGMPHHQECWVENQGCTTFGCMGTIQAVDQGMTYSTMEIPPQSYEEQLSCFKCGFLNPSSNTFCRKCGAKLLKPLGSNGASPAQPLDNPQCLSQPNQDVTQATEPYEPMGLQAVGTQAPEQPYGNSPLGRHYSSNAGIPINSQSSLRVDMPHNDASSPGLQSQYGNTSQAGAFTYNHGAGTSSQAHGNSAQYGGSTISESDFIKVNSDYYRQKFMGMRMENKKTSWNWSAWLFGATWCFYRKMYKLGLLFTGIMLLGQMLPEISRILNLVISLIMGYLGNHFYMRHTEAALKDAESIPDLQRYTYLQKKGGVSYGAVAIYLGGLFAIGILLGVITEFLSYMG